MQIQDNLWLWFVRDDRELQGSAALEPVLRRLEESFLFEPQTVEATGDRERGVTGWTDPVLAEVLDGRPPSTSLAGDGLRAEILQGDTTAISILHRLPGADRMDDVRALFRDLCLAISPTYARGHLQNHGRELYEKHYAARPRSFYVDGLYWLSFFGPEEEERQGGPAAAENPHARAERLGNGLLLEVGDSLFDAVSPEGERVLVAATDALPPPGGAGAESDQPAELTTVDGVRGYLDPADHGFWVTKHVMPGATLDRRTIEQLRKLPGKGDPPVEQVHVLFSDEEAAAANRQPLADAGVRTWYVDLETGHPRPA